ncbi:hypothetical protein OSB04_024395 [Centaurea solstitialis]|uniref:Uncharacterized protein n=1 Tax=Centaurea solstitialis TaxID=347529 RepID=A0AA38T5I6_9ASTR|nr:hypothetical protein OSB04_024395 [Centaurea solstitialis]
MCNQVTSMGYGDTRMFFDPNGKPVSHLWEPYDYPAQKGNRKKKGLQPNVQRSESDFSLCNKHFANGKPWASRREVRQRTASTSTTNYCAPDASHTFMYFMNDPTLNAKKKTELRDTVNRIADRQIVILWRIDWALLNTLGVDNRVRTILEKHAFGENGLQYYICKAWDRVFDIDEPLYRELILEFVASFVFDATKATGDCHEPCMTFRLGGIWRSLYLRIYTQAEIDDPVLRSTWWRRKRGPTTSTRVILGQFWEMVSGYQEGSKMLRGQYITLLAQHFGIFTTEAVASLTNLGSMGFIDTDQLRGMGVVKPIHTSYGVWYKWEGNPRSFRITLNKSRNESTVFVFDPLERVFLGNNLEILCFVMYRLVFESVLLTVSSSKLASSKTVVFGSRNLVLKIVFQCVLEFQMLIKLFSSEPFQVVILCDLCRGYHIGWSTSEQGY